MKTEFNLTPLNSPEKDFFDPLNAPLLKALKTFLESEFSTENLEFAKAIEQFREMGSGKLTATDLKENALKIYNTYVTEKAPKQVNLNAATRTSIKKILLGESAVDIDIFNDALRVVEKLVSGDTLSRFMKTKEYEQAVANIELVKKELDILNVEYQNQPEDNRLNFVTQRLKGEIEALKKVNEDIEKYSSRNILMRNPKKLQEAQDQKNHLLIRQKAFNCLIHNEQEITSTEQRIEHTLDALEKAEENLENIRSQFSSVPNLENIPDVVFAKKEVKHAQFELDDAMKALNQFKFYGVIAQKKLNIPKPQNDTPPINLNETKPKSFKS